MDNLRRHRVVVINSCPMFLAGEESIDHSLLNWSVAQRIWKAILGWFHYYCPLPYPLPTLFESWKFGVGPRGVG